MLEGLGWFDILILQRLALDFPVSDAVKANPSFQRVIYESQLLGDKFYSRVSHEHYIT